jgi:hypothetical protein
VVSGQWSSDRLAVIAWAIKIVSSVVRNSVRNFY